MGDTGFDKLWEAAQGGDGMAQYDLGRAYQEQLEFGRARRWYARAGNAGIAVAWSQLGLLELRGLGIAADPAAARQHFIRAAEQGDAEGRYQLALIDLRAEYVEQALDSLVAAAQLGHPPALRQIGHLFANSEPETAFRLWEAAAQAGDMIAQSALARALSLGHGCVKDAARGAWWARQAADNGSYCRRRFAPLADQADNPEPTLAPELPEVPRPRYGTDLPPQRQHPAADQRITVIEQMLSAWECEYLMEITAPRLRPSQTVHPQTGQPVSNEMRTSYGCCLHPTEEDFVILSAKQRLADCTSLSVRHAEPFALLRYEPGQQYKPHYDFIDPASGEAGRELSTKGQRLITIFCYLTDVAGGGETEFCKRDLRIKPRQGRTLMFHNTLADGSPDLESQHASLPVTEGEKWIATLWLRSREYST